MQIPRLPGGAIIPRSAAKRTVNQLTRNVNRGIVVDSRHIAAYRQPDGRIMLRLAPALAAKLKL